MAVYIEQVSSDSTIEHIEISSQNLRVTFILYTGEKIILEFDESCAFCMRMGWNLTEEIEGIRVVGASKFLTETIEMLESDEEPTERLLGFQATTSDGRAVLEVVARSVRINDELWTLSV